jgi:hypothetical protein
LTSSTRQLCSSADCSICFNCVCIIRMDPTFFSIVSAHHPEVCMKYVDETSISEPNMYTEKSKVIYPVVFPKWSCLLCSKPLQNSLPIETCLHHQISLCRSCG